MQERYKQAFRDTIDYLDELDTHSPFWKESVNCLIDDMLDSSFTISPFSKRDSVIRYLSEIQKLLLAEAINEIKQVLSSIRKLLQDEESFVLVDFLILRQSHWSAIKPVVEAFQKANCVVRIVPIPMIQEIQDEWGRSLKELIQRDGYKTIAFENYHIEQMLPDIVVDNMAVDCAKLPEFRFLRIANLVDYTVHIEHSLLTGYTEAMRSAYFRIGRSRCWQYVVSSDLFASAFPLIFRIDGEFLVAGYPEIDTIVMQESIYKDQYTGKTVLWNIDALDPNRILESDYLRLEKELDYLDKMSLRFPSIIHTIRMHPNLVNQARASCLILRISKLCSERSNIIIDSNVLIYKTYQSVDAMITWMSSTTAFTFAATGKPFAVIPSFVESGYDTLLDMQLLKEFNVIYTEEDMIAFFFFFFDGVDEKKEQRLEVLKKYVGALDGTVGIKIAEKVLMKYAKRRTR